MKPTLLEKVKNLQTEIAMDHSLCTMCQETVRTDPSLGENLTGYLLPGTMTITVHRRKAADFPESQFDHSETRRYCPLCSKVVGDALMGLGFELVAAEPKPPKKMWEQQNVLRCCGSSDHDHHPDCPHDLGAR